MTGIIVNKMYSKLIKIAIALFQDIFNFLKISQDFSRFLKISQDVSRIKLNFLISRMYIQAQHSTNM